MKTLLVGNFGAKNIGDELILSSARKDYPDSLVMTNDALFSQTFCEESFPTIPFFPTGLRSLWEWLTHSTYGQRLKAAKTCQQVVFPGGGLFAISFRACLLWFFVFLWVKYIVRPQKIIFEHQGVDKHLGWVSRQMIRFVFSRADAISTRDQSSSRTIESLTAQEGIPDVGDRVEVSLPPKSPSPQTKHLLLNSLHDFYHTYQDLRTQYQDVPLTFVAFSPEDLAHVPPEFEGAVVFPRTKSQVIDVFSSAEKALGERLHFLICGAHFCGAKNTFTLRKPYSQKVAVFCEKQNIVDFRP